jgi:uncharacterized protein YdeI (YjbR/CyaY-like superfamily)
MVGKPAAEPVKAFATAKAWEAWLAKHHAVSTGLWVRFHKKSSGHPTVGRAEALDVALCYGWIDAQAKPLDQDSWLQRFTPRGPKSGWSKINTGHAERLIQAKRMRPAGLARIQEAQADGRWQRAYDSPKAMTVPEDFLKALGKDKKAKAFFDTLNRANLYAIGYRLQTAKKPETRQRRMEQILEMMAQGKKFH